MVCALVWLVPLYQVLEPARPELKWDALRLQQSASIDAAGACCFTDGSCFDQLSADECAGRGGLAQAGADCATAGCAEAAEDDYPLLYQAALCADYNSSQVDCWYFLVRQCTSFVAWRMNRDAGVTGLALVINDFPFSSVMGGRLEWLGDATEWADKLAAIGYQVDGVPAVGAIAHWSSGEKGVRSAGHVAYVRAVKPDGAIITEEYNQVSCAYSRRTIYPSDVGRFIHINPAPQWNDGGDADAGEEEPVDATPAPPPSDEPVDEPPETQPVLSDSNAPASSLIEPSREWWGTAGTATSPEASGSPAMTTADQPAEDGPAQPERRPSRAPALCGATGPAPPAAALIGMAMTLFRPAGGTVKRTLRRRGSLAVLRTGEAGLCRAKPWRVPR